MSELPYIPALRADGDYAVAPGIEGFAPLEGTLYPYYDSIASPRG